IAIARMQGRQHVEQQDIDMTAHYKSLFSIVRQDLDYKEPLFPGIREMIDAISGRDDLLIGAVTGKSRRGLKLVMETHGFDGHFIVARTADDCPSKPHPAMVTECCDETGMNAADTIVIGDAVYDMQMAKAAGAKAIGVAWGYASVDELIANGADAIAYHPNEILRHFS
ncbi:HAD-IA family hydrolase, partial [Rhizobium ruizarguesonis]